MSKANNIHTCTQTFIMTALLFSSSGSHAEEDGTGHYFPGSVASFVDGVPTKPAFVARLNVVRYEGAFKFKGNDPQAGDINYKVDTRASAIALTLLWSPDWSLGGKWNYAMSSTIPFISIDVDTTVKSDFFNAQLKDDESSVGDIILIPVMFNYAHNKNLSSNYRLTIYAPTGKYDSTRIANIGKNFWTFVPTASVIYFGKNNGIEASIFAGMDFNTTNNDTKYRSGTQAHIDGTLAQHFKLFSGIAGVGITGYTYQQITGDSGEGAIYGDFKARTNGIGPVLSYIKKTNEVNIVAEFKWTHGFNSKNRLEGDTIFFKILGKY